MSHCPVQVDQAASGIQILEELAFVVWQVLGSKKPDTSQGFGCP